MTRGYNPPRESSGIQTKRRTESMSKKSLFVLSIVSLSLLGGVALAFAGSLVAFWDHPGTDENGDPEILSKVRYAVTLSSVTAAALFADPTLALSTLERDLSVDNDAEIEAAIADKIPENQALVRAALRADVLDSLRDNLLPGRNYRLHVQVSDPSDNWSKWVSSAEVIDKTPPSPPTNFGCAKN